MVYRQPIVLLIFIIACIRFGFLFASPLDLSPDEAYYWDWSRQLAFGYYSKPPMIAWIIKIGTTLFGNTTIGVRLPAAILGTLSLIIVYLFTKEIKDEKTALWAIGLTAFSVASSVGSYIMTIDSPLLFFWTLSMFSFWKAINSSRDSVTASSLKGNYQSHDWYSAAFWWILTGISTGLGLLSKQTMIAFPALIFLFLIYEKGTRKHLLTPWPYFAFAISISMLVPALIWNMNHDWITLIHTKHHFEPNKNGLIGGLKTFFELFISLFGFLTPLTFCLILWAMFRGIKRFFLLSQEDRYLFFLGSLPLLMIFLLSFHQRINTNWPAPFFVGATILCAAWAKENAKRLLKSAILLGIVITTIVYASPFFFSKLPIAGTKLDPFVRLRGWSELGTAVGKIAAESGYPEDIEYIISYPRQTVSELAFYMPGQPRVYMFKASKKIKSQYDLWDTPWDSDSGWKALIVKPENKKIKFSQLNLFDAIQPLKHIEIPVGGAHRKGYWIFIGERHKKVKTPREELR